MCYSEEVGGGCIVEYPPKPWVPTDPNKEKNWKCGPATDDDWDSETAEEQGNLLENY